MGILRLKVNKNYYMVKTPNKKFKKKYIIKTSNIFIKDFNGNSISFKIWLENFYRNIQLDNGHIKDQRYIIVYQKKDPITKEIYLIEARTQTLLVFEKEYFSGNGVFIRDISYLEPIDYSKFYNAVKKWSEEDFYHFGQNYLNFIEDGEKSLGELLSMKLHEEEKGRQKEKEYLK